MAAWPDNDVHEECLETYSELVEQTRQIIKEEHGEHGLSDPDLVWEAAQSSGAYNGLTGPDEFLKMADVLVNEFGREID